MVSLDGEQKNPDVRKNGQNRNNTKDTRIEEF